MNRLHYPDRVVMVFLRHFRQITG